MQPWNDTSFVKVLAIMATVTTLMSNKKRKRRPLLPQVLRLCILTPIGVQLRQPLVQVGYRKRRCTNRTNRDTYTYTHTALTKYNTQCKSHAAPHTPPHTRTRTHTHTHGTLHKITIAYNHHHHTVQIAQRMCAH